ncbi:hypothetical protein BH09GEM1_BH09GEM1_10850 [soil metagenome]
MIYRRLAVTVSLALLAACGSGSVTNSIDVATSGSLSFNFTGGGGGTYNATGGISSATLASTPYTTTWAAGYKDTNDNSTNIAANVPRTSTTSDFAAITFKGQAAATVSIANSCTATTTVACNSVSLLIGQSSSGAVFTSFCTLTSGTITIASISSTNVSGSFSGAGTCVTSTGSSTTWIVTNGSFSVPLLPTVPTNLP